MRQSISSQQRVEVWRWPEKIGEEQAWGMTMVGLAVRCKKETGTPVTKWIIRDIRIDVFPNGIRKREPKLPNPQTFRDRLDGLELRIMDLEDRVTRPGG